MVFVFGECELDLARGELRRRGELRHVEPQVFALLAFLLEHRERLVAPAELLEHVWQGRFVTPATLNSRLKAARQAIGDDGRDQQLIRTLRGRGFRFVAPVEVRERVAAPASPATHPSPANPSTVDGDDASAVAAHPTLEDTLRGQYVIEREIGRGGMAVVHLARDLRHQRLVALKVLQRDTAGALGASRFHREIRVAAALQHPNIVPVFDSGGHGDVLWYTMPYVAGGSLRERLKGTARLPIEDAVAVARDVARALAHAHAQGVVHRDIKPENILIADSHALVADFGIARMLGPSDDERDDALTLPGIAVGSPAYMSPEQIAGEIVDGRGDVYALGRVLYEMLAGHLPISRSAAIRMARHFAEPAPRVRSLRPDVPAWLADVLHRALAPHADDRFPTVAQMLDALADPAAPARSPATGADAPTTTLERARAAFARAAWREAYEQFTTLDGEADLGAEDLEQLGEAAWWIADSGTSVRARERAYRDYVRRRDDRGAGRIALLLAEDHFHRLARAVGQGWLRRAERHLADVADVPERGWLHRMRTVMALGERRFDDALAETERALDVARHTGDSDLEALALQDRGRILVAQGRLAEGMSLIDEAMAAVTAGALTPHTTGRTYCNMISTCDQLADFGRAAEWHDAAERWGLPFAESPFPGVCRVFRAGLLRHRGSLTEAEREARRAAEELADFISDIAGEAFYELGAIRLCAGDLAAADAMFAEAHARGRDPQPGLALLRLAEGNLQAARSMIEHACAERERPALDRAKLLPAFVEIVVAGGALDAADAAVAELDAIAATYATPALNGWAALARGEVALARGEHEEAATWLRRARRVWSELDLPYELARTRLLLARAYTSLDRADEAALEERAGQGTLERIGARAITPAG